VIKIDIKVAENISGVFFYFWPFEAHELLEVITKLPVKLNDPGNIIVNMC
jgi:hypothetical protein